MNFVKDEELKLVGLVSINKCLYDRTHKNYRDIVCRENAWAKIAENFPGKSDENCKKRWRTIKDTYVKRKRSGKLGSISSKSKKLWHLEPYLSFLSEDFDNNNSNFMESQCNEYYNRSQTESSEVLPKESFSEINEEDETYSHDTDNTTTDHNIPCFKFLASSNSVPKQRKISEISSFLDKNKTELEGLCELGSIFNKTEDDIDLFYKSIALSVKNLSPHLIAKAKLKHLQIITDLQLQDINEKKICTSVDKAKTDC